MQFYLFVFMTLVTISNGEQRKFPKNFLFGAATAAYQIEGSWNVSDKGENIWDRLTHTTNLVADGTNGDVACDSYNQWRRDIEMLVELGVDYYRFSLSWTRLLPSGNVGKISKDGLRYYNDLIDELIANGIEPFVTLYHGDLPQSIQDLGGWTNPVMVNYFADYAGVAFKNFGDRVKTWLTLNEPMITCYEGYGGDTMAPAVNLSGIGDYLCSHTMLLAHAEVYHLYDKKFRPSQKGRISLTLNANWLAPHDDSPESLEDSENSMQFDLGWFANPIYGDGDYPAVIKDRIKKKSAEQGFLTSRLPEFTSQQINHIRGTYDFFGLNHYTTFKVKRAVPGAPVPSYIDDRGVLFSQDPSWVGLAWLKIAPFGFMKTLDWIRNTYNNPEVIVCENGFLDFGGIDDYDRVEYYHLYMNAMLDAVENGSNITSYTAWSLMDNFEWMDGYRYHFGLYEVDFGNPSRPRRPKKSASFYKEIITNRTIERP